MQAEQLRAKMVGFTRPEDRVWLIHAPEVSGAIAEYNYELTGYEQKLAVLDPLAFRYAGNAQYILTHLAPQRGWRVEEVPR